MSTGRRGAGRTVSRRGPAPVRYCPREKFTRKGLTGLPGRCRLSRVTELVGGWLKVREPGTDRQEVNRRPASAVVGTQKTGAPAGSWYDTNPGKKLC
jgi:hypothetical protein